MKLKAPENFGGGTFLEFEVSPDDLDNNGCIVAPTKRMADEMLNHGFTHYVAPVEAKASAADKPALKSKAVAKPASKAKGGK